MDGVSCTLSRVAGFHEDSGNLLHPSIVPPASPLPLFPCCQNLDCSWEEIHLLAYVIRYSVLYRLCSIKGIKMIRSREMACSGSRCIYTTFPGFSEHTFYDAAHSIPLCDEAREEGVNVAGCGVCNAGIPLGVIQCN